MGKKYKKSTREEIIEKVLEAFAVGDAMGMPTEFMTLQQIREKFGFVNELPDPSVSPIHANLKQGQVTDDTEQVLYLIDEYASEGGVTVEATVLGLLRWMRETGAAEKGYIGPSSKKALELIEQGAKPEEAGKGGTTCGAPMRVLSSVLCAGDNLQPAWLAKLIRDCCLPTHNTSVAMEASAVLGFAFYAALQGKSYQEILDYAAEGSKYAEGMTGGKYVGASSAWRFFNIRERIESCKNPEEAMDIIYNVLGTTMEANEITPSALSIFAYAKKDVWMAIRMGASIGGDTDTLAALAGALSALYAQGHNIPQEIVDTVKKVNHLDFAAFAAKAAGFVNPQAES